MVEDERTKKTRLRSIAERLIDLADSGDIQAMKEIGDRLDGKAAQSITHLGDSDNPVAFTEIKQVIV